MNRTRPSCVHCGCTIRLKEFNDQQSLGEFGISGLCQECQDDTFKEAVSFEFPEMIEEIDDGW